ncbi:thrombomodulin [Ochotona curzoniae]|uniref:thrombomodulin n=1 Tax=Ochotona curzoniae TaxID=130825 RepID=UPI001B350241|nr:thrombomodulin [Ochotona curzoniae]
MSDAAAQGLRAAATSVRMGLRAATAPAPTQRSRLPWSPHPVRPGGMLRVFLALGALAPAGRALPTHAELPQPVGSQCVEHDCFALFRGPATFLAASQTCERRRGHLMTVRSSVAGDVISLLLSGDSTSLWIGLKLPPGCSDPAHLGPLRGFQWVTGDNRTSYSRWARLDGGGGVPLCGPLCVTVSAAAAGVAAPGEPAWEEQPCDAEADGFLCEFNFAASCRPLAVQAGVAADAHVSSTYDTPFGGQGADFQALPVGSSAIVSPLDLELTCAAPPGAAEGSWDREAPGAWDCSVENGGCQFVCNASAGAPHCLCPMDTVMQADGRSCAATALAVTTVTPPCEALCQHFCVPTPHAPFYSCICDTGYRLAADGHHCEDIDDCAQEPNPCQQRCINTKGGFECHCDPGFELVDGVCVKDPCLAADCEYQCQQVGASDYRCICSDGFMPVPNEPHRCQMFCNETACPAICDTKNGHTCMCPEGFILDDGDMCADIDECASDQCQGECRNLPGSYECVCGPDTPLAGQVSTDCYPDQTSSREVGGGRFGSEYGSGELPGPTPGATLTVPPARPVHSGVVIGTSIASLSLVVALLALLCHLRKKKGSKRSELEYKSGSPSKEVVLQQVRTENTPQKLC